MNKIVMRTSATNITRLGLTLGLATPSYSSVDSQEIDARFLVGSNKSNGKEVRIMEIKNTALDDTYLLNPYDDLFNSPIFEKYGQSFKNRLLEFRNASRGWNMGKGEPLAFSSLYGLKSFLENSPTTEKGPAIFLSMDGNISLAWQNDDLEIIELEFVGNTIKYFIERTDEEGVIEEYDPQSITSLLSKNV